MYLFSINSLLNLIFVRCYFGVFELINRAICFRLIITKLVVFKPCIKRVDILM